MAFRNHRFAYRFPSIANGAVMCDSQKRMGALVDDGDEGVDGQREVGTAIIFPSFMAHRVAPVTVGERRSLVAWACGPTFR